MTQQHSLKSSMTRYTPCKYTCNVFIYINDDLSIEQRHFSIATHDLRTKQYTPQL